jgi:hypothetical protein
MALVVRKAKFVQMTEAGLYHQCYPDGKEPTWI